MCLCSRAFHPFSVIFLSNVSQTLLGVSHRTRWLQILLLLRLSIMKFDYYFVTLYFRETLSSTNTNTVNCTCFKPASLHLTVFCKLQYNRIEEEASMRCEVITAERDANLVGIPVLSPQIKWRYIVSCGMIPTCTRMRTWYLSSKAHIKSLT